MKLNIVLAFDSFKGCLSSKELALVAESAIKDIVPNSQVKSLFLADGGEGTLEAFSKNTNIEIFEGKFTNLENTLEISKLALMNNTCVIECAQSVGITKSTKKNVELKTSIGVGEQIIYALDKGCREFIIGLGGSGTNDVGLGMLQALGFEFLDSDDNKIYANLKNISLVKNIETSNIDPRLEECSFKILNDVRNPLCGNSGATFVYGPQKGITKSQLVEFDRNIYRFSQIAKSIFNYDMSEFPGAGAAGGLGYAIMQFLKGEAISGVEYILEQVNASEYIKKCDLVITGEGHTDNQTESGKVPVGVAKLAKKYQKKLFLYLVEYLKMHTLYIKKE